MANGAALSPGGYRPLTAAEALWPSGVGDPSLEGHAADLTVDMILVCVVGAVDTRYRLDTVGVVILVGEVDTRYRLDTVGVVYVWNRGSFVRVENGVLWLNHVGVTLMNLQAGLIKMRPQKREVG